MHTFVSERARGEIRMHLERAHRRREACKEVGHARMRRLGLGLCHLRTDSGTRSPSRCCCENERGWMFCFQPFGFGRPTTAAIRAEAQRGRWGFVVVCDCAHARVCVLARVRASVSVAGAGGAG
jgi:hypothetical protein